MAGCASRHHKWRNYNADGTPVLGSPCVGRLHGQPCDATFLGGPAARQAAPAPTSAPSGEAQTPPADAAVSPENKPAPAPRATLGAALALARPGSAPGAAPAGTAAPGAAPAPPPAPVPNAWQRLASRKMLAALFAVNDKAMERFHREPVDDAPDEEDEEFMEAATELSKSLAIWFPNEALPPWGNALIITAGMVTERWIMSKPVPVEAEDAKPRAVAGASAAATKTAPPPVTTPPADPASPMDVGVI